MVGQEGVAWHLMTCFVQNGKEVVHRIIGLGLLNKGQPLITRKGDKINT